MTASKFKAVCNLCTAQPRLWLVLVRYIIDLIKQSHVCLTLSKLGSYSLNKPFDYLFHVCIINYHPIKLKILQCALKPFFSFPYLITTTYPVVIVNNSILNFQYTVRSFEVP